MDLPRERGDPYPIRKVSQFMGTNDLHHASEITDFYQHIRDYWGHLSNSAEGDHSDMLNFGYWPDSTGTLFEAQQRFFQKLASTLPGSEQLALGLEIGCGIGGISINMLKSLPGLSMTGLDISPQQLSLARCNAELALVSSRLSVCLGDAMAMPLEDNNFDFTLCIESTFHYEDKASFFAENYRVLKPGGYAVVADITCEAVDKIRYRRGNHFEPRRTYTDLARSTGFDVLSVEDIGQAVYRPLHHYIVQFNRQQRIASGKYWSVVLNNYEELAALDLMGYHIFLLRKPI